MLQDFSLDERAISSVKQEARKNSTANAALIIALIVIALLSLFKDFWHGLGMGGPVFILLIMLPSFIIGYYRAKPKFRRIADRIRVDNEYQVLKIAMIDGKTDAFVIPYSELSFYYERAERFLGKPIRKLVFYQNNSVAKELELGNWRGDTIKELVAALEVAGIRKRLELTK